MLVMKKNKLGKFFLSLIAANGRKLMNSEDYHKHSNAERAMRHIQTAMINYLSFIGYIITKPAPAAPDEQQTETDSRTEQMNEIRRTSGLDTFD